MSKKLVKKPNTDGSRIKDYIVVETRMSKFCKEVVIMKIKNND